MKHSHEFIFFVDSHLFCRKPYRVNLASWKQNFSLLIAKERLGEFII